MKGEKETWGVGRTDGNNNSIVVGNKIYRFLRGMPGDSVETKECLLGMLIFLCEYVLRSKLRTLNYPFDFFKAAQPPEK